MGSAQSSNTAKAIAKVANNVSSNTSTSTDQISEVAVSIRLSECIVDGDVNINIAAEFAATSKQIVAAMQQTHIQNSITQQMQQQAQSTVGALGIGFADASNYVSTYASASTDVANYVYTVSTQSSFTDTNIECQDSVIKGDFNVDLSYTTSFWNDQAVKSKQITDISNSITQKVTQKAVAKVEGIGGILIILAILIGIIGYAISKPVGKAFKSLGPAMAIIAVVVIIFLCILMYIKATPPFFSEQQTCSPSGNLGGSDCSFDSCLKAEVQTKSIDKPPLKYMYNIIGNQSKGPMDKNAIGMLDMMIYASGNSSNYEFNQGYNALACKQWATHKSKGDNFSTGWNLDTTYEQYEVPQLPNPLRLVTVGDKYCITPTVYNFSANPVSDSKTPQVYTGVSGLRSDAYISKDKFNKDYINNATNLLKVTVELNLIGWKNYFYPEESISDTERLKRVLHARYILTLASGLDNSIYIFDGTDGKPAEEVSYNGKTILSNSDTAKKYCYKYIPDGQPIGGDYINMIEHDVSGSLTGNVGVCNSRSNKLNQFFASIGNWFVLVMGIIILCVLMYLFVRKILDGRKR